jgi:tRNA (guanine-N7-)-methyltransferase
MSMISDETLPEEAAGQAHELRSFGRRRGRKLSPRQQGLAEGRLRALSVDLSVPAPQPLTGLFGVPVRETWLEIGFGGGEHLLWQARTHPDVGLIGCEPFLDGVVKVVSAIDERPDEMGNIRLHPDDARPLLRWLPDGSIARAFILFPDPWPKARHQKRRLVSEGTLRELARVMAPGAELRLGTDIADYARWMLIAVAREGSFVWTAQEPSDWRVRPADWPQTRYEAKAVAAGRRCNYFRLRRS